MIGAPLTTTAVGASIAYVWDAADRLVTRAVAGSSSPDVNGVTYYACSGDVDSADLILDGAGAWPNARCLLIPMWLKFREKSKQKLKVRTLRALLDKGSEIGKSPADSDLSDELFELLADVDLLEATLTGFISEGGLNNSEIPTLVREQFAALDAEFDRAASPVSREIDILRRYVDRLKEEFERILEASR